MRGSYSLELAYLLWVLGGCGVLGLHRHYLGKHGTGVLWAFTGGLGFLGGAVPDLWRLPRMVEEANAVRGYSASSLPAGSAEPAAIGHPATPASATESLERIVLRTAKSAGGVLTPAIVSGESTCTLEEARTELERWVSAGDAELRATRDGSPPTVYVVPEFLTEESKSRLE